MLRWKGGLIRRWKTSKVVVVRVVEVGKCGFSGRGSEQKWWLLDWRSEKGIRKEKWLGARKVVGGVMESKSSS